MNLKVGIVLLSLCLFQVTPSLLFAKIPTSRRAEKTIAKVNPVLSKELGKEGLRLGYPLYIRIFKSEKRLEIWLKKGSRFHLFKTYPICTYGFAGLGPKTRQGDGKAPEGFYFVRPVQLNPVSSFHLSFNLGYPNRYDRYYRRTGGALMVHGSC